jgi:two-component system LytT family response regulator
MITATIIDDERHCIDRLTHLIDTCCKHNISLLQSAQNIEDGTRIIREQQPQLVFLDVELNDKTGFDLLKQLPDINFEVIFTTAYENYAVQTFKFSAIDYLLKPIDIDDLKQAIEKLKVKISKEELTQKFDTLFFNLNNAGKRVLIPTMNGYEFIQVSDIIRCQSDINYTTIHLKGKQKLVVAKTLKEFEELLSGYNFFRVHNSHLINLIYVKSYNKGKGGIVLLTDGSEVEVSTRRKDELLKKLMA